MSNKLKSFKNLIAMSALAAATSFGNTAKAETNMGEIEDVKETPNGTLVIKKTADAKIGDIPTPWMFGRPDGQSAFATTATQHATNMTDNVVVDETGTNMYVKAGDFTEVHGRPITNIVNSFCDKYINTCSNLIENIQFIHHDGLGETSESINDLPYFEEGLKRCLTENKNNIQEFLYASFTEDNIANIVKNYLDDDTNGLGGDMVTLVRHNIGSNPTDDDYEKLKKNLRNVLLKPEMFDLLAFNFVQEIKEETNDKTKMQQFSLSKDGIPNTTGKEFALPTDENFRLLAARNGTLYTITFEKDNEERYWPIIKKYAREDNKSLFEKKYNWNMEDNQKGKVIGKNLQLSQEPSIKDVIFQDNDQKFYVLLDSGLLLKCGEGDQNIFPENANNEVYTAIYNTPDAVIIPGRKDGFIGRGKYPSAKDTGLQSPITSLCTLTNGNIVACSTNGCVELNGDLSSPYLDEWNKVDPLSIPEPPKGTFKIIDNRGKPNGALLYVTKEKIGVLSR